MRARAGLAPCAPRSALPARLGPGAQRTLALAGEQVLPLLLQVLGALADQRRDDGVRLVLATALAALDPPRGPDGTFLEEHLPECDEGDAGRFTQDLLGLHARWMLSTRVRCDPPGVERAAPGRKCEDRRVAGSLLR